MIKDALRALETGPLAEIGLIAFFVAFVLIMIRVMTMSKAKREHAKQIPLEDQDAPDAPREDTLR